MKRSKASAAIALHPQGDMKNSNREVASIWRPTNLRVRRVSSSRGPSTPVPSWKLYENPFYDGVMQAPGANISARKLAASLWELQEVPLPALESSTSSRSPDESTGSSKSKSVLLPSPPQRAKKKLDQQVIKSTDNNGPRISYSTRQLAAMQSHIHRLLDKQSNTVRNKNDNPTTTTTTAAAEAAPSPENKPNLDGFPASGELLQRLQSLEQSHSSEAVSGVLKSELETARGKVRELEGANRLARREIEGLLKKIADEKTSSVGKEQEKVNQALEKVRVEADDERKLKRRMELANRKLNRELGEAKMALSKVMEELERERKARQLMEDVCEELAREIGDDKQEVEELKRESSRIRQEVEEERGMLQMAEVWREERVHMKLAEAREEIQAKLGALESLREKLEAFLKIRRRVLDDGGDYSIQQADIREAEMLRGAVDGVLSRERASSSLKEAPARSDDTDDDLHSIDLTKEVTSGSSQVLVEKPSWSKLVEEHRQKMLKKTTKKIYCSPNEEDSCGVEGGSRDDEMVVMNDSLRVNPSRSGSYFDSSSDTSSAEFDLPIERDSQKQQQQGKLKDSSNGYGKNLKSLVEWTRNGVKSNRA